MNERKIVMIVDDDLDDRFFFQEALKQINASYECVEADSGLKALEHLHEAGELPHYIFLDMNMPQMNGKEFLAELKKNEKLKNTPVIMYTSSSYHADIEEARALGAAHYLPKTYNITGLPHEINAAINTIDEK